MVEFSLHLGKFSKSKTKSCTPGSDTVRLINNNCVNTFNPAIVLPKVLESLRIKKHLRGQENCSVLLMKDIGGSNLAIIHYVDTLNPKV